MYFSPRKQNSYAFKKVKTFKEVKFFVPIDIFRYNKQKFKTCYNYIMVFLTIMHI